ncbi:MAG: FHA domain-containing protein [Candidatus Obscuribacterales bacterium]|nr:FHA domain-containing protein [Candidatus Obscuribacterales bacterium]
MSNSEPRLPVLVNMTTGERYVLNSPTISLGRHPDNQIVLPDDGYASSNHARIYWDQGQWLVEDLQSSNGTKVNEDLITTPHPLSPYDVVRVGRTEFRIE